jgi:hypothetical protein
MEILHRIGFSRLDKVDEKLDALSIDYKKSPLPQDSYVITFDIAESDPRWPEVASLVQEKDSFDMFETVFSHEEIVNAEWLRLKPVFERGYPQPENTWEQQTYSHICSSCGLAYDQKAPFRLKKEPRMGKHDFLSLYWAYTVFCTPKAGHGRQHPPHDLPAGRADRGRQDAHRDHRHGQALFHLHRPPGQHCRAGRGQHLHQRLPGAA